MYSWKHRRKCEIQAQLRGGLNSIPECIAFRIILSFFRDVITFSQPARRQEVMAAFRPIAGYSAPVFDDIRLLYVHCVSKEEFSVSVTGLEGLEAVFRMVSHQFYRQIQRETCCVGPLLDNRPQLFDGLSLQRCSQPSACSPNNIVTVYVEMHQCLSSSRVSLWVYVAYCPY